MNEIGTWRWTVDYSGDDLNEPASSGCSEEQVDITKATPWLFAAASPTAAEPGSRLQAFTLVGGGYGSTGAVAFRLYAPGAPTCEGTPAYTEETTIAGGAAATSAGFVVPTDGTWRWAASYLGDENNSAVVSDCAQAPVAVVAKLPKPPKDPGGTPFFTNVYFNCVDDHNIGVPYGGRLVLRIGFATVTKKQIDRFVRGIETKALVDGAPVQNAPQYWGKPHLDSASGYWISRWEYDTNRVVTQSSAPFTVEFEQVATKTITDGIDTWNPGDTVVSIGGPCLVAGFAP